MYHPIILWKGDKMAHLVATHITLKNKKAVNISYEYIEKDVMSKQEFANSVVSILFGTYKDCAKQLRDYTLEQSNLERGQ